MKIADKKPVLFQESPCNIWTDPYIQKQMLREHLNTESDGASRNKKSIFKVVDFISNHLHHHSRVLDLGCGPGLYAELLQEQGHEMTGIDFNKASIDYASARGNNIRYIPVSYTHLFNPKFMSNSFSQVKDSFPKPVGTQAGDPAYEAPPTINAR